MIKYKNNDSSMRKPNLTWMLIFADLISLLLVFLIMIYTLNHEKIDRWDEAAKSLTKNFRQEDKIVLDSRIDKLPSQSTNPATALNYLCQVLINKINSVESEDNIETHCNESNIVIIDKNLFFPDGYISPHRGSSLKQIVDLLNIIDHSVLLETTAYTEEIIYPVFAGSYGLAQARALDLAKTLRENGLNIELYFSGIVGHNYNKNKKNNAKFIIRDL